ncbi:flagellar basal-body rod protein FlgF [Chrysiogenes arsenatis]|uniref:flagellar basal-body rod protein FlgF n=1 Tax=Chrysiogenes arsenatis TaxID=309797 RepID=UPI00040089A3|nr:flagellar basal-body rod protein FlgF [Chrysiogenes arsenatis]
MVNGIYTAVSGMLIQSKRLDVVSNNLSNINTAAFKKDTVTIDNFRAKSTTREEEDWRKTLFNETINNTHNIPAIDVDYGQGQIIETKNPYDVAIDGDAFFAVHTPWGERYTRSGNLQVDTQGNLTTKEGFIVKSTTGNGLQSRITITDPETLDINQAGEVFVDGAQIAALKLVRFEDERDLRKIGFNQYEKISPEVEEQPATNYRLRQGYLEMSNVNMVREMVDMIEINRSFQAYQKMVTTIDQSMTELFGASKGM